MSYDVQIQLGFPGELEALLARTLQDPIDLLPNTMHMLKALAHAAHARWVAYASGELALPDGRKMKRWTGQYASSITLTVEHPGGGVLVRYIIGSNDPKADWIENGTQAWDMREVLRHSHKARRNQDGKLYMIVPFRWGTPSSLAVGAYAGREMPEAVHSFMLSHTTPSMIVGTRDTPSVHDPSVNVQRNVYRWGDRLTHHDIADLGLDPETGIGAQLNGMVKMQNPQSSSLGSQYFTFRVITEDSEGWQHPGMQPYRISQHVHEWVQQQYPKLINEALNADIQRMQGG
ncbi:hypothetical protein [Deinococcus cellulosilyticus]|uniref:Uncharacterized protein n=1 Tax=Deinococcus cellulosilyticus (strain DSM 18568 / NBRC 106333 / KACC 11606 / 5516J-15) TaxID=1223518 RepID=A0A511N858_DEIC1|nr:hypothetical protein [Deinococcus cellulosilyticus]GEM48697.1 hypothetical protein DC3_43320 [Deinococcus cellulosilyticus NBRC 106333 = KACC 11606]